MAMAGITLRAVQALEPGTTIWDDGKEAVRGFGIRRQRGQPVYVLKYRVLGRQRFFTIGPHGSPWTPEQARREAKRLLGLVAAGKDPADERTQASLQAADTLRKIADQYLAVAKKKQRPRTYSEIERYLLADWKPLHPVSVHAIHRRHVSARIGDIASTQGPVAATRARAALSAMFNWAIREGLDIQANPVTGTNRPGEAKSRERVLTDAELAAVWRACGDDDYGRIVRLLILTAQRRDEVGGLRWDEIVAGVDPATLLPIPAIRLPPERVKNHREHTLPLSEAAVALLPPRNDRDFIFGDGPRRKGDRHRGYSGWSKSKATLEKRISETLREPLPHWNVHDLRRTAATIMADKLGVLPHIVEAILNHISGHKSGVAGIYNKARYLIEARDALCAWADYVTALATPAVPARPKSIRLVRRT
jgi:integrase